MRCTTCSHVLKSNMWGLIITQHQKETYQAYSHQEKKKEKKKVPGVHVHHRALLSLQCAVVACQFAILLGVLLSPKDAGSINLLGTSNN